MTLKAPRLIVPAIATCLVVLGCSGNHSSYHAPIPALSISRDPSHQTVLSGGNAFFKVEATGAAPLAYQWYRNGKPLSASLNPSAATPALALSHATREMAGRYYVHVTSAAGSSLESRKAALEVLDAPAAPTIIKHPGHQSTVKGGKITMEVQATGLGTLQYQWYRGATALDGKSNPSATSPTLTLDNVGAADQGEYRVASSNEHGKAESRVAQVAVTDKRVKPELVKPMKPVVAVPGRAAMLEVEAIGTGPLRYDWSRNGVSIDPGTNRTAATDTLEIEDVAARDSGTYTVTVSNETGKLVATVELRVFDAPSITLQPADAVVYAGDRAEFKVTAVGENLHYQWKRNAYPVADNPTATTAVLAIEKASRNQHEGVYAVEVSNEAGKVLSQAAKLTVNEKLQVAVDNSSPHVVEGGGIAIIARASGGTLPYAFVWKKNGSQLPGRTSDTLTIASAMPADGGNYEVLVTDKNGKTAAAGFKLTVDPKSAITAVAVKPAAMTLEGGAKGTFSAEVSGTGSFSKEVAWSASGGPIDKNGVYTAPAATSQDQTFTVTATSVQDPTKKGTAIVTVKKKATITAVTVKPATMTLDGGAVGTFSSEVSGSGSFSKDVAWSASGGSIDKNGVYTAPAATSQDQTFTVTATSVQDPSKKGTGTVSVRAKATITKVTVKPATMTLAGGARGTFTAEVAGTGSTMSRAVTWSTTGGAIDKNGVYTAPAATNQDRTFTVTATSVQDPTKKGTATVTVKKKK